MAPTNTPGRKKREDQYFDVGVQGRRTGVTLKDTGIRDEHGLEPTDGIFSSPEKQPAKRTGRKSNGTLDSSEDMDLADSSAPEPTEVLTGRRLARDSRAVPSLPVQRSPIKTNLGATPRRGSSVGAKSPFRNQSQTPHRASSHPLVNRVLDFSITEVETTIEESSQSSIAVTNGKKSKTRDDVYDLLTADDSRLDPNDESEIQVNGTYDDGDVPLAQGPYDAYGDDTMAGSEALEDGDSASIPTIWMSAPVAAPVAAAPKKRGRKRKSELAEIPETQENVPEESNLVEVAREALAPRRRGRPRKNTEGEVQESKKPAKRARVSPEAVEAADEPMDVSMDQPVDEPADEPVEEPVEDVPEEDVPEAEPEAPKKRASKKKPLSAKDPNTKIVRPNSRKEKAQGTTKPKSFSKPGVPHGLQRIRAQTPAEDDGSAHTRSGRLTYKPLDYWRGEHVVLTASERPGLKGIEAICRADDVTPVKRAMSVYDRRPGRKSKQKRTVSVFEDDHDDDEEEPWELDAGTISGPVRIWDSEMGAAPQEDEKDQQLAYASRKIEPRPTHDNPNFCFTKTLTMPFFGAGVIELPPGGYKGTKNSRRFQFLFFVHYGKVTVDVAGNRFVITKGGMWQVPRGNFYSIANETDHPAKIIFAQGCEAESQPLMPTTEAETEAENVGDVSVAAEA